MATQAILNRLTATRTLEGVEAPTRNREQDDFLLRPIPSEDIFFYSKYIDNARMVRKSDPKVRRSQAWMISTSLFAAVVLVSLMLPALYSAFAGYQVERLRQENARLRSDIAVLTLQEEKILSPQHIEELSRKQSFIDPDPARIFYLDGKHSAVAKRVAAAKEQVQ